MLTQERTSSKASPLRLADVAETGLLTLYCRAQESLTADPVLKDDKAVEVARELNPLLLQSESKILKKLAQGRISPSLRVHISLRAAQYDRYARDFLSRHPDGIVVNLGCGLDSRFLRIDDGRGTFFDLDLPEVIQVKRQFFQETDRYRMLGASVFDEHWMDSVLSVGICPVLFLAEGLFMYLEAEKVKNLVLTLRKRFPGCELACEVVHQKWVNGPASQMVRLKMQGGMRIGAQAVYRFGIAGSRGFESWDPGIHFLDEWCYFDTRHPKLGLLGWMGRFEMLRHVQWTVRYRLG